MKLRKILVTVLVNLVIFAVGLKVLDLVALKLTPPLSPYVAGNSPHESLLSMELQPYTGLHIRSNSAERGRAEWTKHYTDFNVRSGDKGFFIDFELSRPPAKKPEEFRIVLVGGSAAQGMGGRSNEEMFYAVLEKRLNALLTARNDPRAVRVINLAMGSSFTYQNYIALNRWAHPLEPDLILSFSGRNDFTNPSVTASDLPYHYQPVLGLVEAAQFSSSPDWVKSLFMVYPALVRSLRLDLLARMYRLDRYADRMTKRYSQQSPMPPEEVPAFQAHALNSIRRDFPDIPIVFVAQPINRTYNKALAEAYAPYIARVKRLLLASVHVYDMDQAWLRDQDIAPKLTSFFIEDDCHFNNEGHELVARQLSQLLLPIMDKRRKASGMR